jgi:hypothetical protein
MEENDTHILIPKGTTLHHFVTKNNKDRDYRWYYLAVQDYINTTSSNKLKIYKTNRDIFLLKYHLSHILNRKTRQRVLSPGIYCDNEYCFARNRVSLEDKNTKAAELKSIITYENSCENTIDPIREQYIVYGDKTTSCVEYELVIPNDYAEEIF